jgi:hypothetical protein
LPLNFFLVCVVFCSRAGNIASPRIADWQTLKVRGVV